MNTSMAEEMSRLTGLMDCYSLIGDNLKKETMDFINKVLMKCKKNHFYFTCDDEFVEIIYDGGAHPERDAYPYALVESVYLTDNGKIIVETDSGEMDLSVCLTYECYNIAQYMSENMNDNIEGVQ